jgi:hypothetical protein
MDSVFTNHIWKDDQYAGISVIARYDEIKEILAKLVALGYELTDINLAHPSLNEYYDEYICTISGIWDKKEIWCEPMLIDDKYIKIEDNIKITYILDNCSSKVIKVIDSPFIYEVNIGDDEDIEDKDIKGCSECSARFECEDSTAKNTKVAESKTETKGVYKVNGKAVSKDEFDKAVKRIDDMYEDSVRDMLLRYSAIQDEMNDLRRFLYL